MPRRSAALLAALLCASRGAAEGAAGGSPPSLAGACLTVRNDAKAPLLLARSNLENKTLAGGAQLSLNLSANETLWVVPSGADWHCKDEVCATPQTGCPRCFLLRAEAIAAPKTGGNVAILAGFGEVPRIHAMAAPVGAPETGTGHGAMDRTLLRLENATTYMALSGGKDVACLAVVLGDASEAQLRGAYPGWPPGSHSCTGSGSDSGSESPGYRYRYHYRYRYCYSYWNQQPHWGWR